MSQSASVNAEQKTGIAQSAEGVVAIALFAVCAAAGLAAWLLSGQDLDTSAPPAAVAEVSAGLESSGQKDDELAVLSDWQQRLDSEFNQRDQARRQQAQSQAMQQQAEALAAAQAAANAAQEAAAAAEARALAAERERQRALEEARRQQQVAEAEAEPKPAPQPASTSNNRAAPAAATERVAAAIDWESCRRPVYPQAAVRFRQEGTVILAFEVDAQGNVADGSVKESSGYQRLDNAALQALSRCRFEPERVAGRARASSAEVRFAWRLD